MNKPLISIILCTYNNSASLEKTLTDLSACIIPENIQIELICVDNNSPDNTPEVFEKKQPLFNYDASYAFESKQGLSHARNLGLKKARGEYLLFTDDDAEIPINWIVEYNKIIKGDSPDCLYSKIHIVWDQQRPNWYQKHYQSLFVHLDFGEEKLNIEDVHHEFFGKNFCVNKLVLIELGGFDPELGRTGEKLIAGEETLIYRNLIRKNKKVIYFPTATVGHRLKPREYEFSNVEKMYSDGAYSSYHLSKKIASKKIFNRPLYPLKNSIMESFKCAFLFITYKVKNDKHLTTFYKLNLKKNIKILSHWLKNA